MTSCEESFASARLPTFGRGPRPGDALHVSALVAGVAASAFGDHQWIGDGNAFFAGVSGCCRGLIWRLAREETGQQSAVGKVTRSTPARSERWAALTNRLHVSRSPLYPFQSAKGTKTRGQAVLDSGNGITNEVRDRWGSKGRNDGNPWQFSIAIAFFQRFTVGNGRSGASVNGVGSHLPSAIFLHQCQAFRNTFVLQGSREVNNRVISIRSSAQRRG